MATPPLAVLLTDVVALAVEAGVAIEAARHGPAGVRIKADGSPVSKPDRDGHALIVPGLQALAPGIPVVSEEGDIPGPDERHGWREFWLVDPLDGTREFINKRDEFTVNIALVRDRRPVFGLVYAPATQELYVTLGRHRCAEARLAPDAATAAIAGLTLQPIQAKPVDRTGLIVLASRSHMDDATKAFIARHNVKETRNAGSSLKFCVIARGDADLYPRFGPTMEWDTAAGHAVLTAAGGSVTMLDGTPFLYGKTGRDANPGEDGKPFLNPGFLAWGRPGAG